MSKENNTFLFKASVVTFCTFLVLLFIYIIFVLLLPLSLKIIFENIYNKQMSNIEKKIPEITQTADDEIKKRLVIRYIIDEIKPYSKEFLPLVIEIEKEKINHNK